MKRNIIRFFRLLFARGEKAKTRVRRSEAQLRRVRKPRKLKDAVQDFSEPLA